MVKRKNNLSKKIMAGVLATSFLLTAVLPISSAKAETKNNDDVVFINETVDSQDPLLGGGPSPSAAWTKKGTYTKTFTVSQLRSLNTKLQSAVKAGKKTQTAYNAATAMVGLMGWPGTAISFYFTFCTVTQPNVIQESANTVAKALSRNKSTTIRVERWVRPATNESMCVYKSIVK